MTREPTDMEERVARAICTEICEDHLASGFAGPQDFQKGLDVDWPEYLPTARAAIRAMREPTTEMLREAGLGATSSTEDIAYMWETMIDAASPQEE
tara:strand:- start:12540 stop:12827 length:288 start_codon:yes stop_codon:yes gene_type:complete